MCQIPRGGSIQDDFQPYFLQWKKKSPHSVRKALSTIKCGENAKELLIMPISLSEQLNKLRVVKWWLCCRWHFNNVIFFQIVGLLIYFLCFLFAVSSTILFTHSNAAVCNSKMQSQRTHLCMWPVRTSASHNHCKPMWKIVFKNEFFLRLSLLITENPPFRDIMRPPRASCYYVHCCYYHWIHCGSLAKDITSSLHPLPNQPTTQSPLFHHVDMTISFPRRWNTIPQLTDDEMKKTRKSSVPEGYSRQKYKLCF